MAAAFANSAKVVPLKPDTLCRSLAIGSPDGNLAVATARSSAGAIYGVAEDEIGPNMSLLAETCGVFGETAAGVTLGALRKQCCTTSLEPPTRSSYWSRATA